MAPTVSQPRCGIGEKDDCTIASARDAPHKGGVSDARREMRMLYVLIGSLVGFIAMLAGRGRAGIAVGLAFLGFMFGFAVWAVSGIDFIAQFIDNPDTAEQDWDIARIFSGVMAAVPGVAGALLARRD